MDYSILSTLSTKPNKKLLSSEVAIDKMLSFIGRIADPDELLSRAGIQRYQLRQLELDDEVAQCVDTRREAVVATPWRLEPNQNRVGKWLTNVLEPHIETLKRGVMDARLYGYSVFEVIYTQVKGGIGILRLVLKPMEWFAPQRDGTLRYYPNDGSGGTEGVDCSPIKFILTVCNGSYRNPYGEALLSRLWFPITWRREGWGMWLQFLETFGEPIILGQVQNYQEFVDAMIAQGVRSTVAWQGIGEDHVEAINASTPGEFERLENAIIRRVQKLILGQTLTSDVGSNGSYAVAAIHNEVRNDKRRADLRMVQSTGQHLVNCLALINNFDPPKFIMADDAGLEMHRAQRDSVLLQSLSASGLKLSRRYFEDRFDFQSDDLEEKVVDVDSVEDNIMPEKDTLDDTGITKSPTRDRSVVDENQLESTLIPMIGESTVDRQEPIMGELTVARQEPLIVHLNNSVNLPEGLIKQEPTSVHFTRDADAQTPIQVHVAAAEVPAPIVHVAAPTMEAPIVNLTLPESTIVVNVPTQEPSVIHMETPVVNVTPEIKVQLGTRQTITEIERDEEGQIIKTHQIESDVSDESIPQ